MSRAKIKTKKDQNKKQPLLSDVYSTNKEFVATSLSKEKIKFHFLYTKLCNCCFWIWEPRFFHVVHDYDDNDDVGDGDDDDDDAVVDVVISCISVDVVDDLLIEAKFCTCTMCCILLWMSLEKFHVFVTRVKCFFYVMLYL